MLVFKKKKNNLDRAVAVLRYQNGRNSLKPF